MAVFDNRYTLQCKKVSKYLVQCEDQNADCWREAETEWLSFSFLKLKGPVTENSRMVEIIHNTPTNFP